jgi:hypothetical protein
MADADLIQRPMPNVGLLSCVPQQAPACARLSRSLGSVALALAIACDATPPPPDPLPPNTFAFGVFGDGPYRSWEFQRYKRLLKDVERSNVQWLLHVGDLFWYPCSDANMASSRDRLNALQVPVVYTPGDNEWADCHEDIAGGFLPLERLSQLRLTFFARPLQSLGSRRMTFASQMQDSSWREFVENKRWRFGGFLFLTIHIVGSNNALAKFPGRTANDDGEADRRTHAAYVWLGQAFDIANRDSLRGIVVAMHADPGFEANAGAYPAFVGLMDTLAARTRAFARPVLLIHGDGHEYEVDHPFLRRDTVFSNFTRLETFGSPDIGWVRVVIDSLAGKIVRYEPRVMPRRGFW